MPQSLKFLEPYLGVVIGWFLATLTNISAATFRAWRRKRTQPVVHISFENDAHCILSTPAGGRLRLPGETGLRMAFDRREFVRLRVNVSGNSAATACRAFLVGLKYGVRISNVSAFFRDSIPAAWSYRSHEASIEGIQIPPGVDQFIDVLHLMSESLHPTCIGEPTLFDEFGKLPGIYQFSFCVTSDNARPVNATLQVTMPEEWNGKASSLTFELLPN